MFSARGEAPSNRSSFSLHVWERDDVALVLFPEVGFIPATFAIIATVAKNLRVLRIKPQIPIFPDWLNVVDVKRSIHGTAAHASAPITEQCCVAQLLPLKRTVESIACGL